MTAFNFKASKHHQARWQWLDEDRLLCNIGAAKEPSVRIYNISKQGIGNYPPLVPPQGALSCNHRHPQLSQNQDKLIFLSDKCPDTVICRVNRDFVLGDYRFDQDISMAAALLFDRKKSKPGPAVIKLIDLKTLDQSSIDCDTDVISDVCLSSQQTIYLLVQNRDGGCKLFRTTKQADILEDLVSLPGDAGSIFDSQCRPRLHWSEPLQRLFIHTTQSGQARLDVWHQSNQTFQTTNGLSSLSFYSQFQISPSGDQAFLLGSSYRIPPTPYIYWLDKDQLEPLNDTMPSTKHTVSSPVFLKANHVDEIHLQLYRKHNDLGAEKPVILMFPNQVFSQVFATWPSKAHHFNRYGYDLAYLNSRPGSGYGLSYQHLPRSFLSQNLYDLYQAILQLDQQMQHSRARYVLWGGGLGAFRILSALRQGSTDLKRRILGAICVYPVLDIKVYYEQLRGIQRYELELLFKLDPSHNTFEQWLAEVSLHDKTESIHCPILIFQGGQDSKRPAAICQTWAEQQNDKASQVAFHLYPDEQDSFKSEETYHDYYQKVEEFLNLLSAAPMTGDDHYA